MLLKTTRIGVVIALAAVLLFVVAGLRLGELKAYLRASADSGIEELTGQLPPDVQNKKLAYELRQLHQDLIEREVGLNVARKQVEELRAEVAKLEASTTSRKRLLAEAYPVLKAALDKNVPKVRFAKTEFALDDFQHHLDDLLRAQERETQQLTTKREGLTRLEKHVREGVESLAALRQTLEKTEQEAAALRDRREQAEFEAKSLEMLAKLGDGRNTNGADSGIKRLREQVTKLEAENDVRRNRVPSATHADHNAVSQAYQRLQELRRLHEQSREDGPDN